MNNDIAGMHNMEYTTTLQLYNNSIDELTFKDMQCQHVHMNKLNIDSKGIGALGWSYYHYYYSSSIAALQESARNKAFYAKYLV